MFDVELDPLFRPRICPRLALRRIIAIPALYEANEPEHAGHTKLLTQRFHTAAKNLFLFDFSHNGDTSGSRFTGLLARTARRDL